jgi:hypothetical protein
LAHTPSACLSLRPGHALTRVRGCAQVVIILSGRYAGKKAIIVTPFDEG